jgi:nitrite reductase/ring-hydroxylating ferredoxin subunit/uncharacterized membrane protein
MASESMVNAIAKYDVLDDAAQPLQELIRAAFKGDSGRALKNFLHGLWLGHPLHPAFTDIPIGAWSVALAFDALERLTGRRELRAGADAAIGIGLLGAAGSAITGLTDFSEIDGRARRVGIVHGVVNVIATSLYLASYTMRKKQRRDAGIALSMLGFLIAGFSANLGGHLVFGEQVGVDHTATADATEPKEFTRVAVFDELEQRKPKHVTRNGVAILLMRSGDHVYAITDTCPHLGGPLSEGKLHGNTIECPWHGSQFRLEDGRCVNGPSTFPARCFEVRVRDGNVEVRAATKQAGVT